MHVFIAFLVLLSTLLIFIQAGYFYVNNIKVSPISYLLIVGGYAIYSVSSAYLFCVQCH